MSEQRNPFDEALKTSGIGANPFTATAAGIFGSPPLLSGAPVIKLGSQSEANPFEEHSEAPPGTEHEKLNADVADNPGDKHDVANMLENPEPTDTHMKEISGGQLTLLDPTETQTEPEDITNPLAAVIGQSDCAGQASIFAKPPVFEYGAVREPIEDPEQTFEDLRIVKADDFPELEDGIRVSWDVTYGKIRKSVPAPKKTKIGEFKKSIESSKEFMDALKKDKDKSPDCIIKPRVTAQSKGDRMPMYKGVYLNLEEAEAAGKVISIVPARDGKVYEIRREEMGTFITPVVECRELSEITAGFTPALPLIPRDRLLEVISFFRSLMLDENNYEAIINIYWDKNNREYVTVIPKQRVTATRADSELSGEYEPGRYIHYMDVHSHNVMPARFSAQDNADEKATRLYAVIGKLDDPIPELSVRISNGGKHLFIDPETVFEHSCDYHATWNRQAVADLTGITEKLARNIVRVFVGEGALCA